MSSKRPLTGSMSPSEIVATSRKRSANEAELEIDVNAAEPLSKKALRKAKRSKVDSTENSTKDTAEHDDNANLKRLDRFDSERSSFGVWIGNLSFTTTKRDLLAFLTQNEANSIPPQKITRMHLPLNEDRRAQNRGFAYVDFDDAGCVEAALALNESLVGGRRLLIKDAKNFQGRPAKENPAEKEPPRASSRKIFIGNLDFGTSKEDLIFHFKVCGSIASVFLATFEDSGKCKGYGWIEFEDLTSAEKAMRGWVDVEDPRRKMGPVRDGGHTKRVWLHRMGDRKLRMEYAEDPTTRYKKRFGKSARESEEAGEDEAFGEAEESASGNDRRPAKLNKSTSGGERSHHRRKSRSNGNSEGEHASKYDSGTVARLTGAIVEGTGQKTTFD